MHAIDFLEAPQDHKTGPAVAVFGKERFLKLEVIKRVCGLALGPEGDEMGVTRLAGGELELKTVVDSLLTVSMWSPRQVVLVEDADDFVSEYRSELEDYLERPAKKGVLILDLKSFPVTTRLAKKVAAVGLSIDCGELKGPSLVSWIIKSCKIRHGKKIDRAAAQLIVDLAGTELGLIDQELAKLAAYVGSTPSIDAGAVEKLVGGWRLETTWKMLDAVRDGNVGVAIELLDKLLAAGEPAIKLMGGINFAYRPVARGTELSRQGQPLNAALAEAGVKPFNLQPMVSCLKRIGRPRAEQILRQLITVDVDLKRSSGLTDRMLLERLLLQLAGKV
jgi:DNA polymerase-3 subunit delta